MGCHDGGIGEGLDVIGDVHGQYDKLVALLGRLGYERKRGVWSYPGRRRKAVFLGDLIDRGPGIAEVCRDVMAMEEAGNARCVMGNHELNAVLWMTPDGHGGWLRPHTEAHACHHRATLEGLGGEGSPLHRRTIEWFRGLPLWMTWLRASFVHACLDPQAMRTVGAYLDKRHRLFDGALTSRLAAERAEERGGHMLGPALSVLLKGMDVPMPDGVSFVRNGKVRRRMHVKWWMDPDGHTWREVAMMADRFKAVLPDEPVPDGLYHATSPGRCTFVGHYWLDTGSDPAPQSRLVACLDYGAGHGGPLTAYRWNDGDKVLHRERFVQTDRTEDGEASAADPGGPVPTTEGVRTDPVC